MYSYLYGLLYMHQHIHVYVLFLALPAERAKMSLHIKNNEFIQCLDLDPFLNSFTHMCIHCLGHFSPLPPTPFFSPHPLLLPGRICSALISKFVEEKV
jgi:hypothetical protein